MTYIVKAGDTASSIAKANNITVDQLVSWNNLIHAGQVLKLKAVVVTPPPVEKPWIWAGVQYGATGIVNSIRIVQRALNSQVGSNLTVDGVFGDATKAAYQKWQEKLGFTGADADGYVGVVSLKALSVAEGFDIRGDAPATPAPAGNATAANYETLAEPAQNTTRTTWGGRTVNKRSAVLLDRAVQIAGFSWTLTQGSYNTGVAASAGTHDKGGCVDVNVSNWSFAKIEQCVQAMRKAGWAAWYRNGDYSRGGFDGPHIHAVDVGNSDTASLAKSQVQSYFNGGTGLASNGADTDPPLHWPNWADKYNK